MKWRGLLQMSIIDLFGVFDINVDFIAFFLVISEFFRFLMGIGLLDNYLV